MTCLVRPLRCVSAARLTGTLKWARRIRPKKGVCSNYLCDSKPGDDCKMTGPSGKVMLMPEENSKTDYIMVPLALALPRTVDLSVAFSPRLLLPVKHTKALR